MPVLATYSPKGGVGKTSATVNLSCLAARSGLRTLVWDLDPQGAATYLFRAKARVKGGGGALVRGERSVAAAVRPTAVERLDLVPADFSYRHLDLELDDTRRPDRRIRRLLREVGDDYDVVFLDCPPGATLVAENVLNAASRLLVPVVPSTLSARTLAQLLLLLDGLSRTPPPMLVFLSMVDSRRRLHQQVADELRAGRDDLARAAIPVSAYVERMGERREPVAVFAPSSPAALAYEALWAEVRALL